MTLPLLKNFICILIGFFILIGSVSPILSSLSRHTSYRHLNSYMDPDQIRRLREVYPDAREDSLSYAIVKH